MSKSANKPPVVKREAPKCPKSKKIKNDDLFTLYTVLSKLKSYKLERDALLKYIPFRVKLKSAIYDPYEKLRVEASEQTKPEGFDEMSEKEKSKVINQWDSMIRQILNKWFEEEQEISLETHIFDMNELVSLFESNPDLVGGQIDLLTEYLLKNSD